jgi:hypothetical protein
MDRCHDYESLIERMLADEIEDGERDRLLAHAECCTSCRQFVELHHRLLGPELELELPTDEELADVRGAVLNRIRAEADERAGPGATNLLRMLWLRPAYAGALAAMLTVVLGAGVLIGWRSAPRPGAAALDPRVVLPDAERALYSNVSLSEADGGTMTVGFDVTRHVEMQRRREDPLVRELLVQSLLNEPRLGARLEAMSHAQQFRDPEVKQALILTLLNDPNQVVRQRALEILTSYESDDEIQAAMIAVLRTEETIHLRLLALDLLATSDLAPERLDQLLGDLERRQNRALLVRAGSYFPASEGVEQ